MKLNYFAVSYRATCLARCHLLGCVLPCPRFCGRGERLETPPNSDWHFSEVTLIRLATRRTRRYQSCKFRPKSLLMPVRSLFIFPFAPIFLTFPAKSKFHFLVRSLLHIPANLIHLFQRGHYLFFQPSQYSSIIWLSNAGPITHLSALFKINQHLYHPSLVKGPNWVKLYRVEIMTSPENEILTWAEI